jgi:hypothetical protein
MFEETYSMLKTKTVPLNISYKSFKCKNQPLYKFKVYFDLKVKCLTILDTQNYKEVRFREYSISTKH